MKAHFVDLTDGTRLEIKMNFATIYHLQKRRSFGRIVKKQERAEKKGIAKEKALTAEESMELAANVIYAIIRSNGRAVSFDEALELMPPGETELTEVIRGFQDEYEKYSKKKQAKTSVKPEK